MGIAQISTSAHPAWLNLPPERWPASALLAFEILAEAAERRLEAEAAKKAGSPTAPPAA